MTVQKGFKDYSVAVVDGRKTLGRSSNESDVSIEVAAGVRSVIMKPIQNDFDSIRKSIPKEECLISPVVFLHAEDVCEQKESAEYRYKAMIPHYLPVGHNLSSVKVRCGNIKRGSLREIGREKPQDGTIPYYEVETNYVTLHSNHFCDVVCTSTEKVCTTKVIALPFGLLCKEDTTSIITTRMKMKTYMCSYLYSDSNLQSVSILYCFSILDILSNWISFIDPKGVSLNFCLLKVVSKVFVLVFLKKLRTKAGGYGYDLLDELTIPFDHKDPDVEKSAVTVGLTVDGPVGWKPTYLRGKTWDPFKREILQVCCLFS